MHRLWVALLGLALTGCVEPSAITPVQQQPVPAPQLAPRVMTEAERQTALSREVLRWQAMQPEWERKNAAAPPRRPGSRG